MKVANAKEAWSLASRLFPFDYEKDDNRSKNAGYPIYHAVGPVNAWISDLGDRLELNYTDGKTENIWIEQEEKAAHISYKVYITKNADVAHIIARGLRESAPWRKGKGVAVSIESGQADASEIVPGVYKKDGYYYAALVFIYDKDTDETMYDLTIC